MGGEEAKPTGVARAGIVLGAVLALMLVNLDSTIAAVALPHMQGSLSTSQDEINWVVTSYIVAVAIMTAPSGWLANRYGRKRVLICSVAGFTLASIMTGFAQSLDQVVIFRFFQGLCGAPLVPLSQSLLLDTYEAKYSNRALSWWSLGATLGPTFGPSLGGWITEHWEWRWVFFINVPFGILGLIVLVIFVPETRKHRLNFDWIGFVALSVTISAFQLVMDRGSEKDWFGSNEIIGEACVAGLGLYFFVVHSLTTARPFIEFGTLRDRNFACGTLYMIVHAVLIITGIVLVPAFLQNVAGDPVGFTGLILTPRAMGGGAALIVVGWMQKRMDPRFVALIGLLMMSGTLMQMAGWTRDVSVFTVLYNGFIHGAGATVAVVPIQTMAFAGIASVQRNGAATVFGLTRNIGQSIGVSAATALLVHNMQVNHAEIAAHVTMFNQPLLAGAVQRFWDMGHAAGRMALDSEIGRQSMEIAYLDDFRLLAYVTLTAVPLVFLLRLPGYRTAAAKAAE